MKSLHVFYTWLFCACWFARIAFAQSGPTNLNIGGTLFESNGAVVTNSSVNFKFQIYDKTGACLLYSEEHVGQDLSHAKGGFSLELGQGSNIANLIDAAHSTVMTSKVFENSGSVGGGWSGCPGGTTLGDGDNRLIRVMYDLGSGFVTLNPDVPITAAAYAVVAETLQGKRPADFLQVRDDVTTDLSQANLENIFSSTNYAKLNALVNGSSSQYMVSSPSAAVGFNGQRITNVADPSGAGDVATKNYADSFIGGKVADLSTVGPAMGNGETLIWDQAAQKWKTGVPSATDTSKLPLAGGQMSGDIDMNGHNILAAGHITMSSQMVFNLGTFDNAQEAALMLTLTAAQKGASWYNSQDGVMKVWNGTTVVSQAYLAAGKIDAAWIPDTGVVAGSYGSAAKVPSFTVGADGRITAVTELTIGPADLGLGTAALENVGVDPGDVPQLDGSGKIPSALLPAAAAVHYGDIVNAAGQYMSYAPNNAFCTDGETLKWNDTDSHWVCGEDGTAPTGVAGGGLSGNYPNPVLAADAVGTANIKNGAIATEKLFANPGINRLVATDGSSGATLSPFACTNTQIMQWSTNGWVCVDLVAAVAAAGNIGIGTAMPSQLLDVNGPIHILPTTLPSSPTAGVVAFDSTDANALKFYNGSSWQTVGTGSGNGDFMKDGSVAMTGNIQLNGRYLSGDGGNEGVYVDSSGHVGIGTTTPNYQLDVAGNINSNISQALYFYSSRQDVALYSPSGGSSSHPSSGSSSQIVLANQSNTSGTASYIDFYVRNTDFRQQHSYIASVSTDGPSQYGPSLVFGQSTGNASYSERMRIDASGNIGIGTTAPRSGLDVAAAIVGKAATLNGTSTIDFSTGNVQYTTSNCGSFALQNLKDGGSYAFIVQGTASATCTFTAFSDGGTTALTVHLPPDHGATIASKHTVYNLMIAGTHAYFAWTPGY